MPAVDKGYNVSKNREERAIAGLSMGGAETLYTGPQPSRQVRLDWIVQRRVRHVAGRRRRSAGRLPARALRAPPAGPGGRGRGAVPTLDASVFDKNFPTLDAKANSQIRMLWIVCGTADSLIGVNRQFKDWLKTKNVSSPSRKSRTSATCGRSGGRT